MQAMPILGAILGGRVVNHSITGIMSNVRIDDADLNNTLLVRSDEALEMYWHDTEERFDPSHDFGPLRLPGDQMWIEFKTPRRGYADGEWRDLIPLHYAVSVTEQVLKNGNFRLTAFPYVMDPATGGVASLQVGESMIVDPDGRMVPGSFRVSIPGNIPAHFGRSAIAEMGEEKFRSMAHVCRAAYIAIGLMNCKNVTTTETDKGGPKRSRSRRKRSPRLTYHTINIPGYQSAPSTAGAKRDGEPSVAVHRVRGHFKTFTAEKPLMGRHVGTYWWGWQVRGNAKNGAVVSDYKVSKPAA